MTVIELVVIAPIECLFVIVILVGLLLDGSRVPDRAGGFGEVGLMSVTALGRLATWHVRESGRDVQRDDHGFKLFVRPGGGRRSVASLATDRSPAGHRFG